MCNIANQGHNTCNTLGLSVRPFACMRCQYQSKVLDRLLIDRSGRNNMETMVKEAGSHGIPLTHNKHLHPMI